MASTSNMILAAGIVLLAVAALHDIAFRTIPNAVPLLLAGTGIALRLHDHHLLGAILAGAIVFALAALAWQRGWMGGGDVKLLAAAAILVPPLQSLRLVLFMALAGGLLGLVYLVLSYVVPPPSVARPRWRVARIMRVEQRRVRRRASIPYGVAIAAGAAMVLFKVSA
jgi:prepilin peptidase CpaA